MPVTRSQKGPEEVRGESEETRRRSGRTASGSKDMSTGTTEESTATGITEAAVETATSHGTGQKELRSKGMASQKICMVPEGAPVQAAAALVKNPVPVATSRRARSTRTTSSSARRRELEAREELARRELEKAEAAERLARVRLELAQCEEEDSVDEEDPEDRTAHVQEWIQTSMLNEKDQGRQEPQSERLQEDSLLAKVEQNSGTKRDAGEIQALADVLREALTTRGGPASQPKYIYELPYFDGNSSEWLAFKVVYEDTSPMFSDTQNMARLRRAIKGNAREAIKSLLYSEASPIEVMQALKRRYGRPDALVLAELEKVRALPRISDNPRDICVFGSQVNNSVAAIKGLKKPQYLHSPEMMKQIVEKMPTILKFRWYDFTAETKDELSDLTLISKFLNNEADKCGAYATPEEKSRFTRSHRQTTYSTKEMDSKDRDMKPEKKTCPQCQREHLLLDCPQFQKASVQDRWTIARNNRVCYKCLRGRHRKEGCRKPPCMKCKRWHHHMLHVDSSDEQKQDRDNEGTQQTETATDNTAPVNTVRTTRAYLKMTPVEVYGPKGSKKIIALMDEGSTVSLLDAEVAKQIGATGEKEELCIETVGSRLVKKKDSQRLTMEIRGIHDSKKQTLDSVWTIDDLKLAPQFLERRKIEQYPHLEDIAGQLYYEAEPPQLLIGQDNWELIISKEIRKGKPGQPVASRTELGWVIHGCDTSDAKPVHFLGNCLHVGSDMEKEMHPKEEIGLPPIRPMTDSDARALPIPEKTCGKKEYRRFNAELLETGENMLLLKKSQEESFKEDLKRLQQNKQLDGSSKLKRLDVINEEGLLRLKGKINAIENATVEYKQPIVLDSKNRIARKIIEDYHCRFNHGDHATVTKELRKRFWIIGLRSTLRIVQHQCVWCRKNRAKPRKVLPDDLPEERLRHGEYHSTMHMIVRNKPARYPGPDSQRRIHDVKTRRGALRRPSSRVVLPGTGSSPYSGVGAKHKGEYVGDHPVYGNGEGNF